MVLDHRQNNATRHGGPKKKSVACEMFICEAGISTRLSACSVGAFSFLTVALPVRATLPRELSLCSPARYPQCTVYECKSCHMLC